MEKKDTDNSDGPSDDMFDIFYGEDRPCLWCGVERNTVVRPPGEPIDQCEKSPSGLHNFGP